MFVVGRAHQDRHDANSIHGGFHCGKPQPSLASLLLALSKWLGVLALPKWLGVLALLAEVVRRC